MASAPQIKEFSYRVSQGWSMAGRRLDRAGAPCLLFVHGLGCSMDYWKHIWDSGHLADYSLLAVDLLGFGRSDKPEKFDYKLEHQADTLAELIASLGTPVTLIGHSMGGVICNLLLSRKEVIAFANLEGNLTPPDAGLFSRPTSAQSESDWIASGFDKLRRRFPDWPKGYVSMDSCTAMSFYRSARSLVSWTDSGLLLGKFQQFAGAKCYIHGEKSDKQETLKSLGDIHAIPVANSGHFAMVDNPADLCQAIGTFLRETFPTGT